MRNQESFLNEDAQQVHAVLNNGKNWIKGKGYLNKDFQECGITDAKHCCLIGAIYKALGIEAGLKFTGYFQSHIKKNPVRFNDHPDTKWEDIENALITLPPYPSQEAIENPRYLIAPNYKILNHDSYPLSK